MTSRTRWGSRNITLQFDLRRGLDSAAQDVQCGHRARLAAHAARHAVLAELSQGEPRRPVDRDPRAQLEDAAAVRRQRVRRNTAGANDLPGARRRSGSGLRLAEVRGARAGRSRAGSPNSGIGLDDVASAIQGANVNLPTGVLYGPNKAFAIETNGQLQTAAGLRATVIVAYRNGAPVRIADLGRAIDSVENDKTAAWLGSPRGMQRAVVLAMQKQPGANTVEVVRGGHWICCRAFGKKFPRRSTWSCCSIARRPSKAAVHDVQFTLLAHLGPGGGGDLLVLAARLTATSFPACRCRWRSWPRSRSCTCWASRSTTCR